MGRELQKRKRRSSRAKVQTHNRPKKLLNPLGNDLIAQNWNKDETMSQNYRRLGLVAKLGKATGGLEARPHDKKNPRTRDDPLAIKNVTSKNGASVVKHVRVERDAAGRIVRVLGGKAENPLGDPLNELDSDEEDDDMEDDGEEWGGLGDDDGDEEPKLVHQLEKEANRPTEKKHIRHQSEREREWLQRLVDKHGDDMAAMARDPKLNPMQQTKADIAKRLKVYKADLRSETA